MKENFKPSNSFEIENSKGFFEKLLAEWDDFDREHLNPRFAINAAITSWHLTDWTFQEFFRTDSRFQDTRINGRNSYKHFSHKKILFSLKQTLLFYATMLFSGTLPTIKWRK